MISDTLSLESQRRDEPSRDPAPRLTEQISLPPITYAVDGESLSIVVADIAAILGISVVVDASIDRPVTLTVHDIDAARVFEELAEQAGVNLTFEDGLIRFTSPATSGVASIGVFRTGFDAPEEVEETTRALLGHKAVIRRIGDRIVVGGSNKDLTQFSDLSQYLEAGPDSWTLEVRLISLSAGFARTIGLDWTALGELQLSLGDAFGDLASNGALTGARAAATVAAIAEATASQRDAQLITVCRLLLLEGETATFQSGESIPVPRRVVSDAGTVSTTDFQIIDTGFLLSAAARRVPGGVRLDLRPELSTVTGFIGDAPIVSRRVVESSAIVSSGEWVILTGFDDLSTSNSRNLAPAGTRTRNESNSQFVLVLRAIRTRHALAHPFPVP